MKAFSVLPLENKNQHPLTNCQYFFFFLDSHACSAFVLNKFQLITRQMVQNVLCDHHNPVCYAQQGCITHHTHTNTSTHG